MEVSPASPIARLVFENTPYYISFEVTDISDRMTLGQCQNQNKGPDTFLSVTNVRISVVVVYAVDREF